MPEQTPIQKLLQYDQHISSEIRALTEKFVSFPDKDLDRDRSLDFSLHLEYTEQLFHESAPLVQDLHISPTDPDFKLALEAKSRLQKNNDQLHRLRNAYQARFFPKQQERDLGYERDRTISYDREPEEEEPLFPISPDELTDEDLEALEQEAMLAALEEELAQQEAEQIKAEKRKKESARQKKFAKAGADQDAENARLEEIRQEGRRTEALRMGMRVGEGQQLSEAQLRSEQIRQESERRYESQKAEAYRRLENETFEQYRQRLEHSERYQSIAQVSHNDFNAYGGDPTKQSQPSSEPLSHGYEPVTPEAGGRFDATASAAQHRYPSSDQAAENARLDELRQEGRRAEALRMGMRVGEGQQLSEAQLRSEQARQESERLYKAQQAEARMHRDQEAYDAYRNRMAHTKESQADIQNSHYDFNAYGGDPTKHSQPVSDPIPNAYEEKEPVVRTIPVTPTPVSHPSTPDRVSSDSEPARMEHLYRGPHTSQSQAPHESTLDHREHAEGPHPHAPYAYGYPHSGQPAKHSQPPSEPIRPVPASGTIPVSPTPLPQTTPSQIQGRAGESVRPGMSPMPFQQPSRAPVRPQVEQPGASNTAPTWSFPTPKGMQATVYGTTASHALSQQLGHHSQKPVPAPSYNNWTLYRSACSASPPGSASPISPAVEQQMIMNVQTARLNYNQAETHDQRVLATKIYRGQRSALQQLRTEIKNGRFQVQPVNVVASVPPPPGKGAAHGPETVFTSPTPTGRRSRTFSNTAAGTGTIHHTLHDHATREAHRYSRLNPLRVTPDYDKAITQRYKTAKANVEQLTAANRNVPGFRVPPAVEKEFTTASEAFLGYNRAKAQGTVVIDQTAQRSVPDYKAWQQRQRAANLNFNLGAVFGTTAQGRSQNANRPTKASVEEISASLLKSESLLKRKSLKGAYARSFGYRLDHYSRDAGSRFGRKVYNMLQSSDEDGSASIRTFESGRYYITTGAQLTYALLNSKDISTKALKKAATNEEIRLFGKLSAHDNKALAAMVARKGKDAEKAQALLDLRHRSAVELKLGQELEQKLSGKKLSERLSLLDKELGKLDKNYGKKLQKSFSVKGMQNAYDREASKLSQKFGRKVVFHTKGKDLATMTTKSIDAEIQRLRTQGSTLKEQIKRLQSKGAALSKDERKLLSKLMQQHKEGSTELSRLIGFRRNQTTYEAKRKVLTDLYKGVSRKINYLRSGGYMLVGFVTRAMRESQESGVQGMIKLANISSNHYVHILVKNSVKASIKTNAWLARKTGVAKAAQVTRDAVKASKPVVATQNVIRSQVTRAQKITKRAVRDLTPQKVRTASRSIKGAATALNSHTKGVATGIRNTYLSAKRWAASTKVGQGILKFNGAVTNMMKGLGAGLKLVGGLLVKFIVFDLLAILVVALLCAIIGLVAMLFSSVIMSPEASDDGRIDLSSYVETIGESKTQLDASFAAMGAKYDDYRIIYASNYDNTKEMLSMMAVYFNQDLDPSRSDEIEEYLDSLFDDSHPYDTAVENYKCSGCKTKTVSVACSDSCPEDCEGGHTKKKKYCDGHKRLLITVDVLGFDEIFEEDSMGNTTKAKQEAEKGERIGYFTITYYCSEKYPHICNNGPPYLTANGTKPMANHTIAADTSVKGLSMGSEVVIDGTRYVVEDRGGGVNGNHIDIFVDCTHEEALAMGKRFFVPVYTVSEPDPDQDTSDSTEETGEWQGWTEDKIEWAKNIYSLNWSEIYSGISEYNGYIETGDLIVEGDFVWPVTNTTSSSGFGWRTHPVTGEKNSFHTGTDIAVPTGTPVHAAADGTVTSAKYSGTAGNMIIIDHGNGITTRYYHNSELFVKAGDKVSAGQVISASGNTGRSTGPHLHFEFRVNGNPIDPRKQYKL